MLAWVAAKVGMSQIKALAISLAVGLVIAAVGGAWIHYSNVIDENRALTAENEVQRTVIDTQDHTIDAQRDAIDEWDQFRRHQERTLRELAESRNAAEAEKRRINEAFDDHDLERLALERPAAIQRRVDAATDRSLRLLRCASGADGDECPGGDQASDVNGLPAPAPD